MIILLIPFFHSSKRILLAIAPLATVLPGFIFAAFTDVNPPDSQDPNRFANGTLRRHGLSGLLSAIREFNANRRHNQTLHITSDNHHHG